MAMVDRNDLGKMPAALGSEPAGAARRVYQGILQDLEQGRLVPGQRLIETDLAAGFAVGRNAVREAMQHLAVRGVIDLTPNRSPAIRRLDLTESLDVIEVAQAMTVLTVRAAAERFVAADHAALLADSIDGLTRADTVNEPGLFGGAQRNFYRTLLLIGRNSELQRLFPALSMHIVRAQYPSPRLRQLRLTDYRTIADAVAERDPGAAEAAAIHHIEAVRAIVTELAAAHRQD